jgi:hypothetical protein
VQAWFRTTPFPGVAAEAAIGAVKAPGYLVPATFLHSDVKRGAFLARKNNINGRSAEHHTSTPLIRIRRE